MDSLNRLTQTDYAETATSESSVFDLAGNRESYIDRASSTFAYTLANAANEYATINAQPVGYDTAGNLTTDEAGRTYQYDERNRLIAVRDSGSNLLASYTYDALGRRITATIGGETTRYYYDGPNVIEERNAADNLIRTHVNGSQYIDERVVTTTASGESTYYLLGSNYSVAGTGNADGSTIDRLDYSATGSFAGSGGGIDVDYDNDNDVDLDDLTLFQSCVSGAGIPQNSSPCADRRLDDDEDVDQSDFGLLQACYSGDGNPALPECTGHGAGVANGAFALHGRPVDVLPDGHTLLFVRARYYDLKTGRWLQRDPLDYADGNNLYESFKSNATSHVDPSGKIDPITVAGGTALFLFIIDRVAHAPGPQDSYQAMQAIEAEENAAVRKRVTAVATIPIGGLGFNAGRAFIARFTANRLAQVAGGAIAAGPLHTFSTDLLCGDVEYYIAEPKQAVENMAIDSAFWFAGGVLLSPQIRPEANPVAESLGKQISIKNADPMTRALMDAEIQKRVGASSVSMPKMGASEDSRVMRETFEHHVGPLDQVRANP